MGAKPGGIGQINRGAEESMLKAIFGAGCFWGVEDAFRAVNGVKDVVVGYSGGSVPDPA